MKRYPWVAGWLLGGFAASAVWTIAQGAEETARKATPGKDSNKSSADTDPRPGPYPEDDIFPAVERGYQGSGAYRWLNSALHATAREHERHGARPTIGSRNLAICVTAMYDAWAAYDAKAVGTRLGGKLRRPPEERTTAKKDKAIGSAVRPVLLDMYP